MNRAGIVYVFAARAAVVSGLLLLATASNGQQIQTHTTFGGMRFEMDTLNLTHRQVSELLSINPVAAREFALARRSNTISGILGFAGAVLLAIPITSAILGGDPEWGYAAGGAILIAGSIPINNSYKRRAVHAVETYNAGLSLGGRLYFRGVGVGIRL